VNSIGFRLRQLRKQRGFTQDDFAELIGTGRSNLSRMERGEYPPGKAQISLLKEKLNVNPDWILYGETPIFIERQPINKAVEIPVLADIPAGDWKFWIDSYYTGSGMSSISCPELKGDNLFAIRVDGVSMYPMINDNDYLVINPHKVFTKGLAVVRHDFGEHLAFKIRMVRKHGKQYILTPVNPQYDELTITPNQGTRLYVPIKVISMRDL